MEMLEASRKNIVVLGAGFGGITALLKLHRAMKRRGLFPAFNLVLVSKNAHHLYTPALYEIASIPQGEVTVVCLNTAICIQVEDITSRLPAIRFFGETATALDPRSRRITFASGNQLPFEYAVIALGAETNFFGIPGLAENAYAIKTFEDAVKLRSRVEELVRSTARLRIIVGGAGATGVELSAEFVNYLCYLKERVMRGKCREEITLLEANAEILSGFSAGVIARARRRLGKLGVKILTTAAIERILPTTIVLRNGRTLPYDLLVWSGGVKPAGVLKDFGVELDKKGGVIVNEFLQAEVKKSSRAPEPRIYAVGDNARFFNPKTKKPLGGNIPVAEAEARLAAANIIASIAGEPLKRFKPLTSYPFILAVGGKYAITDLVIVKFFGFLGWVLKQIVELRYLLFILPWPKAVAMWLRTVYYSTVND